MLAYILYGLHIWKQQGLTSVFFRSLTENIIYYSVVWHCSGALLQDHLLMYRLKITDSRISLILIRPEYIIVSLTVLGYASKAFLKITSKNYSDL